MSRSPCRPAGPAPATPATASPHLAQALGHPLADKRLDILRGIQVTGSISQAARVAAVSYKAAWQALDTLTNLAGVALVERSVGGAGGGGTRLTPAGLALLEAADHLAQARAEAVAQVQQPQVLGVPAATHLTLRTSMRNQWPCTVQRVDVQAALAQVTATLAGGQLVHVRLTAASAELLALQPGQRVLAMAKATAIEVLSWRSDGDGAEPVPTNRWPGQVTRIAAGAWGDEVAVVLEGGVHMVGFAAPGSGLRRGRKVWLQLPAAAVVLAL